MPKGREIFRTPEFRLTVICTAGFAFSTIVLFGFIFWQTAIVETKRVDRQLIWDARTVARESPQEMKRLVEERLATDFHHLAYAALFDAGGRPVAGNLDRIPPELVLDGKARRTRFGHTDSRFTPEVGRMVGLRFGDGQVLVIGRDISSLENFERVVGRALGLGGIPALVLALAGGALFGWRAQRQMAAVHRAAERIIRGDFSERLPVRGRGDDFNRLADSVNRMLDGVGQMLDTVKSTGNHIAHDLRSPLTRVRTGLECAYDHARTHEELRGMVERAIGGLDQTLVIIEALLRIGDIENGRCRSRFHPVDLKPIVLDIGDLYGPLAEERHLLFQVDAADAQWVRGDSELLTEAIVNLVDNAVKFTPSGGRVRLSLQRENGVPVVRVADNGPGIACDEREAVMQRFYRADKTRHIQGHGLGLNLVDAIARLHGFQVVIGDAHPGCIIDLICRPEDTDGYPRLSVDDADDEIMYRQV